MDRRTFLSTSATVGLAGLTHAGRALAMDDPARFPEPAPLSFRGQKSGLKITAVRAVELVPKRPLPEYQPAPGSWNTTDVEIANPLSIYPRFKPRRSLFYADDLGPNTVMVETDKGITGFGYGGPGAAFVVERHLPKLLVVTAGGERRIQDLVAAVREAHLVEGGGGPKLIVLITSRDALENRGLNHPVWLSPATGRQGYCFLGFQTVPDSARLQLDLRLLQ